jgi:hypothetical protein
MDRGREWADESSLFPEPHGRGNLCTVAFQRKEEAEVTIFKNG